MTRFPHIFLRVLLFAAFPVHATGLSDTGQDTCYDGTSLVACTTANSGDAAAYPRQDGRFGRDAAADAGPLSKTGAGDKGFDFTKMCMSGELAGQGSCPANPAQGTNQNEWACTKDNVTNLIWPLENGIGDWTTYATTSYPAAMNATNRCGYSTNWRLPTRRELLSIVHNGGSTPAVDSNYLPGTLSTWYWSADTYTPVPVFAWYVYFVNGGTNVNEKSDNGFVQLVRSVQ